MKYWKRFLRWFTVPRVARCVLGVEHLFIAGAVIHTVIVLTGDWGWWAPLAAMALFIVLEWWAVNSCDETGYAFYNLALPNEDDSRQACDAADAREAMELAAEDEALAERDQGIAEWQHHEQWKRDRNRDQSGMPRSQSGISPGRADD